ncbi:MAG: arylsulfatase [Kiritimatiellae bacterium]|nr:arylsulfatase [Kiritimatiellia bacterium]
MNGRGEPVGWDGMRVGMRRGRGCAAIAVAVWLGAATAPGAARPPNLVIVLADDLAAADLGCYGQQLIRTPRLDRMASEGMRFTRAYSGTAVCAPTRASLLTGLHTGHCPIRANREVQPEGQMPLPAGTPTIASVLKARGYATACVGKWGLGMFDTAGSPLKVGFDHFYGYNCQRHAHSYFPAYLYCDDRRFELPGNDGRGIGAIYSPDLLSSNVLAWVRSVRDRPFFLFYAPTLPHGRYEVPNEGEYADRPWPPKARAYAAMVSRLDADVGRLLDLLVELELHSHTLVIFGADNGSAFDPDSVEARLFNHSMNGRLRGAKRSLYEGGLVNPTIAWWPGTVPAGVVRDEPWAYWDLLPTFAELAGVPPEAVGATDGRSIAALLRGGPAPERPYFYWELHEGTSLQAARFGRWKAVRNGPSAPVELYDLESDPGESRDLASAHPELVRRAEEIFREAHRPDPAWPLRDGPLRRGLSAAPARGTQTGSR